MGNTEWSLVHGKLHAFNYCTSVILNLVSIYTVTSSKILSHVSVEEVLSVIKVK